MCEFHVGFPLLCGLGLILILSKGKLTWHSPLGCGVSFKLSWWGHFILSLVFITDWRVISYILNRDREHIWMYRSSSRLWKGSTTAGTAAVFSVPLAASTRKRYRGWKSTNLSESVRHAFNQSLRIQASSLGNPTYWRVSVECSVHKQDQIQDGSVVALPFKKKKLAKLMCFTTHYYLKFVCKDDQLRDQKKNSIQLIDVMLH